MYCFLFVGFGVLVLIFFFSSRRRHTLSYGDWSSDVCSSDLAPAPPEVVSYLNVLKRDGVVIIPDFLDAGAVARMRDAVPDVAEFDESPEGDGAYRYPDADRIADFRPFFDHAIVPQIVRSYLL